MVIDLFQKINFTSHSGLDLTWKIEMDALSREDWECISHMIIELSPPFKEAVGIPRGGTKLGKLLNLHGTGKREDPICIVDDVLTTGGSMEEFKTKRQGETHLSILDGLYFLEVKHHIGLMRYFKCHIKMKTEI